MTELEIIAQQQKQIEQLTKALSKKDALLLEQNVIISNKDEVISDKDLKIESLEHQLYLLRKQIFGKKSEKNLPLNPEELRPTLFDEVLTDEERAEIETAQAKLNQEIESTLEDVKPHKRKKRDSNRTIDTSKLEVEEIEVVPEGINLADYTIIDTEVSDKLIFVPSRIYIERTIRPRYVLKSHLQIKNPEQKAFEIAPIKDSLIPRSLASSSLLTEIIIDKFVYHLPFYRIINKFKELGLSVSDSTMGDWFSHVCRRLKPIYNALKEEILSSDYIQVDETTLKVIDTATTRNFKGYVWVMRDAISGATLFYYDNGSRSSDSAYKLLGNYRGAIQVDGYKSYEQFERSKGKIILGCMAHARRKFVEALSNNKRLASEAIHLFGKLYTIEKEIREAKYNTSEIELLRRERSYPILQEMERWLEENHSKVLKSSPIGLAISYTHSLLPRLSRYILDGRYNIDNNFVESAIRPLAVGRKNWLHAGSPAAAIRNAMIYSFIASCKAVDVEPAQWLRYVLDNIGRYEKNEIQITELLPSNFKKTN